MRRLDLTHQLPEEQVAQLEGTFLEATAADQVLGEEEAVVYKPNGTLLLHYIPDALPQDVCTTAQVALRKVGGDASNRGTAAGVKAVRKVRHADGRRSGTTRVPLARSAHLRGVKSAVVGAFERNGHRYPTCRLTAFNLAHPELFAQAVPFFQACDQVLRQHVYHRWAAQMAQQTLTHEAWRIHNTSFTTVTVNKDFRTAVHKDQGDLATGFGVMSVFRAGTYSGCHLVFPAFRVAVDMRTRGVLLADVHEWHGNTPLEGVPGRFERLSTVLYHRAKMHLCGSPEEEVEHGKRRKPGDPIW